MEQEIKPIKELIFHEEKGTDYCCKIKKTCLQDEQNTNIIT